MTSNGVNKQRQTSNGMNWFFGKRVLASQKNGQITVTRIFGRWRVSVKGIEQSGNLVNKIWRDAITRIEPRLTAGTHLNILLLGLGAGGILKILNEKFPDCHITAVEYDPIMIALTKELGLFQPYSMPVIIEGDAGGVVPTLKDKFDLLIVDFFNGREPPPFLREKEFVNTLRNKASSGGIILINVCGAKQLLDDMDIYFSHSEHWKYRYNWLGAFY